MVKHNHNKLINLVVITFCALLPSILFAEVEISELSTSTITENSPSPTIDHKEIFESNNGLKIYNSILVGPQLIYDCQNQHYVCVDSRTYDKCIEDREEDKKRRSLKLRCAPLRKYEKLYDCVSDQYKYVHNSRPVSFCMNI